MAPYVDQRIEEAQRASHDEIARRLGVAGVPVKKDTAVRNNVGYLAKVQTDRGTFWTIARNVYMKMIQDGTI